MLALLLVTMLVAFWFTYCFFVAFVVVIFRLVATSAWLISLSLLVLLLLPLGPWVTFIALANEVRRCASVV